MKMYWSTQSSGKDLAILFEVNNFQNLMKRMKLILVVKNLMPTIFWQIKKIQNLSIYEILKIFYLFLLQKIVLNH